jgi:hypothetical protein
MSADCSPAVKHERKVTPDMLRAGYTVIGEFDPDITCLASVKAIHFMLKSVYIAMNEVRLGNTIGDAIQISLGFCPRMPD